MMESDERWLFGQFDDGTSGPSDAVEYGFAMDPFPSLYYNNTNFDDNAGFKWHSGFETEPQSRAHPYLNHASAEISPTPPYLGTMDMYSDVPFDLYDNHVYEVPSPNPQPQSYSQPQSQPRPLHHSRIQMQFESAENDVAEPISALDFGCFSSAGSVSSWTSPPIPESTEQEVQAQIRDTNSEQNSDEDGSDTAISEECVSKPIRRRRRRKKPPPSVEEEELRREKLLERNRVAAARCRKKRKSMSTSLEERARNLRLENNALGRTADALKEEMLLLKTKMLDHADCGCTRVRAYLDRQASSLALACPRAEDQQSNARCYSAVPDSTFDTAVMKAPTAMSFPMG